MQRQRGLFHVLLFIPVIKYLLMMLKGMLKLGHFKRIY